MPFANHKNAADSCRALAAEFVGRPERGVLLTMAKAYESMPVRGSTDQPPLPAARETVGAG